jgi:outer membrane protein assembly factor BamB
MKKRVISLSLVIFLVLIFITESQDLTEVVQDSLEEEKKKETPVPIPFQKDTKIASDNDDNSITTDEEALPYHPKDHNTEKDETVLPYIQIESPPLEHLSYNLFLDGKEISDYNDLLQIFPQKYSDIEGILTFRGNHLRNTASYGVSNIKEKELVTLWSFTTDISSWGGGAGWTGQPAIVKWSQDIKQIMNLKEEYKQNEDFVEVIYASLDGNIYFLYLDTGNTTRDPIPVKNPIKGSLSIDPRGYPLLYVGEGIPENGSIGYSIYSLIDHSKLHRISGSDPLALRRWGAFDNSAIINRETDTLLLGGENGLFYNIKLNTRFDQENKTIKVDPALLQYRYTVKDNPYQGIENSVAVYKNLAFFADNGGSLQCIDLRTMKPVWALEKLDDTDASITIEVVDDVPFLYTGTEVDHQGLRGYTYLRKINGLTGDVIWQVKYKTQSDPKVNGGMLATNVIGKHDTSDLVIFTLARYNQFNSGIMVALDKATGKEVWTWTMPNYAWSSPVDLYDQEGHTYLIQCDSMGNMYLLEGKTGKELYQINLGSNIEASPAVFNDTIVVATRGQKIFGIKIK